MYIKVGGRKIGRRKTRKRKYRRKIITRKSRRLKKLLILEPQLWNKVKVLNKNNVNIKKHFFYLYKGKPVTGGSANPWYVVTKKNIKEGHKFNHNEATKKKLWEGRKIPRGLRLLTKRDILNINPYYNFTDTR